jgi:hypothetical protein
VRDIDWKVAIVRLVQILEKLHRIDPAVYEYPLPYVRASDCQLAELEREIGEPLPHDYRAFLAHAGGWRKARLGMDLLTPGDLLRGEQYAKGREALSWLEESGVLAEYDLRPQDLHVIGLADDNIDLFVLQRYTTKEPGVVRWFASYQIEVWQDFSECFLGILELNRRDLERRESKT